MIEPPQKVAPTDCKKSEHNDNSYVSGQPFHLDFARPTRIHYST